MHDQYGAKQQHEGGHDQHSLAAVGAAQNACRAQQGQEQAQGGSPFCRLHSQAGLMLLLAAKELSKALVQGKAEAENSRRQNQICHIGSPYAQRIRSAGTSNSSVSRWSKTWKS